MATTFNSDQMAVILATPPGMLDSQVNGGRVRAMIFTITLAASGLATGDDIRLGELPKGARVLGGQFVWGTAQGATATIAVGIAGATGKYFVAAVTNSLAVNRLADTLAQNHGAVLTAREVVLATNAAAAWTASSVLKGYINFLVD